MGEGTSFGQGARPRYATEWVREAINIENARVIVMTRIRVIELAPEQSSSGRSIATDQWARRSTARPAFIRKHPDRVHPLFALGLVCMALSVAAILKRRHLGRRMPSARRFGKRGGRQ